MDLVTGSVGAESDSSDVRNLQDALLAALERGAVVAGEGQARRTELAAALREERERSIYGDATRSTVAAFQSERGFSDSGEVDAPTAQALNTLLREWGLLNESEAESADAAQVVFGVVSRADGLPLGRVTVRALHNSPEGTLKLGEDITDAEGRYTIRYPGLPGGASVNLTIEAAGAGRSVATKPMLREPGSLKPVDVIVPIREQVGQRWLVGTLILTDGRPAEGVELLLYGIGFGGARTALDKTTTLAGGRFAFDYAADTPIATLAVSAVMGKREVPLFGPFSDEGGRQGDLNINADARLQPVGSEYDRLVASLRGLLPEGAKLADAVESDSRQDITVLHRATGWDARLLALAATAERLAADPELGLSAAAAYGLLRVGLPSDKQALALVEPETVDAALKKASSAGIIAIDAEGIGAVTAKVATFAMDLRLQTTVPGSRSTYQDILNASGLDKAAWEPFSAVHFRHRGQGRGLWAAAEKEGVSREVIAKLRRVGKLAFLTGNSAAMTRRLVESTPDDPARLVDGDFDRPEVWVRAISDEARIDEQALGGDGGDLDRELAEKVEDVVPIAIIGATAADRIKAYAEEMARKVRRSYPTEVLAHRLAKAAAATEGGGDDEFILAEDQGALVDDLLNPAIAAGFRFGTTPVGKFLDEHRELAETFLKKHGKQGETVARAKYQKATRALKTIQSLYQLTPGDDAMLVLKHMGTTSGFDVMGYPEEQFLTLFRETFQARFGRAPQAGTEESIRRKAAQITSITNNLFAVAKIMRARPGLAAVSTLTQSTGQQGPVKTFPTLESLFGSIEYCECEHCRSVLSPAAYLVDLLQFLDTEEKVWEKFVDRWKESHGGTAYPYPNAKRSITPFDVLIDRRPDLPHIALTCENTHTELPYIDIFNELLEFFVAKGGLTEAAARDTVDASSAELLAEPQNVIGAAYQTLAAAQYPLTLPFDLWLETARQFCASVDTSLAKVLEAFRTTDALFDQGVPVDRASIFLEQLGLSPAETAIFISRQPLDGWYRLYGYDNEGAATIEGVDGYGQRTDLNSAKALARRLGVTYKELAEILMTDFVNPDLVKLRLLDKLGLTVAEARFYTENIHRAKQDPDNLAGEEFALWREVDAISRRLRRRAADQHIPVAVIEDALATIPIDNIVILADPETGCDFDQTIVCRANASPVDPIDFLRINLFVRLWRKLGWSIADTGRALGVVIPSTTPYTPDAAGSERMRTALIYCAHLKSLEELLRFGKDGRQKLLSLFSNIPTTGEHPLYAELFLSPSLLKMAPVFDDPFGEYLSTFRVERGGVEPGRHIGPVADNDKLRLDYDPNTCTQYLAYRGFLSDQEKDEIRGLLGYPANDVRSVLAGELLDEVQALARLATHLTAVQGALGLTADEIEQVLEAQGTTTKAAELSIKDLSFLYRHALLARALKLSIAELLALKRLAGIDPFLTLDDDALPDIADGVAAAQTEIEHDNLFSKAIAFVKIVAEVRESGFKIEDLEYLLQHAFDPVGKYRQNSNLRLALIRALADGIAAIRAEHSLRVPQQVGLLLPGDVADRFFAMLEETAVYTATVDGVAEEDAIKAEDFRVDVPKNLAFNYVSGVQTLIHHGVMLTDEKESLAKNLPRFAGLLDELANQPRAFFTDHLLKHAADGEKPERGYFDIADYEKLFAPLDRDATKAAEARRDRLRVVAEAFLPGLEQRLIRQFVVEKMTAHTGADAGLVDALLVPAARSPNSLLDDLTSLGEIPADASTVEAAERAVVVLEKAVQMVEGFGLSVREVSHFIAHAGEFGGVGFQDMPATAAPPKEARVAEAAATPEAAIAAGAMIVRWRSAATARFSWFRRLAAYARLKRDMAGGSDDLIGVFAANDDPSDDRLAKLVYPAIAAVTRRSTETVEATAEVLFTKPSFANEEPLQRLWQALQLVERFGVQPLTIMGWTEIVSRRAMSSTRRYEIAREIRETFHARLERDAWLRAAQPIFDRLRARQRDALAAYAMHRLEFARIEQLYEYFLVDPGMEPVVRTSRIRLAISSVQLFVQRCFLNLEAEVHPTALNAEHWEWMKRYRVWEANRKIFLFPENWLEPEFRDDKSHLFTELEGTLLQDDVSNDLAEDALLTYLRKLEELARLDMVAMHIEDSPDTSRRILADPSRRILHVFGRTFSSPHKYFYRRWSHGVWTPWEPVGLEIEGDHLAPVVWRDRLYLFWVTFIETPGRETPPTNWDHDLTQSSISDVKSMVQSVANRRRVEAHLHWSEYLKGEWTTGESSEVGSGVIAREVAAFNPRAVFVHVSKAFDQNDGSELGVSIHLTGQSPTDGRSYTDEQAIKATFYLEGRNSVPESGVYEEPPSNRFSAVEPETTRYDGSGPFSVTYNAEASTDSPSSPGQPTTIVERANARDGHRYLILPANNALNLGISAEMFADFARPAEVRTAVEGWLTELATLSKPIFYQDTRNTFFVEPDLDEETIETWEDVPITTLPVLTAEDLDDLLVIEQHPRIVPQDPQPEPEYDRLRRRDWLVNSRTALLFDQAVIGPAGQAGIEMVAVDRVTGAQTLAVNPGSDAATASRLVIQDAKALARSGLAGTGINIVGRSGASPVLGRTLANLDRSVAPLGGGDRF